MLSRIRHSFCSPLLLLLSVVVLFASCVTATIKYNQRMFVNARAINFADPTKHGFRIVLHDDFLKSHLAPTLLPTLFISAIPLKSDEPTVSKVFYPDTVYEDKQVNIVDLRERSWYYVCVEWENFNRHNETTGSDCRLFRTLDRFGKSADSALSDIEITDIAAHILQFRIRALVDYPVRVTASLQGGAVSTPASQSFVIRESADLDVLFPFLRPDTEYGKLCVLEEPLVTGYTAMGRLVAGMNIHKCYFDSLKTKDYDLSTMDAKASAFKRAASATPAFRRSFSPAILLAIGLVLVAGQR